MKTTSTETSAKRTMVRFAILEAPAVVLLAMVLAYLFVFDNNLSDDNFMFLLIVAVGVFLLYLSILFVTVLMPAARGGRDAR